VGLEMVIVVPWTFGSVPIIVEALTQYPPVLDESIDLATYLRPEYEIALTDFIVSRAMFKEGGQESTQALSIYARFLDAVQQLSGRNIIRRYPSWDVGPDVETSPTTLRGGAEEGKP
jgi:hypothetical protein